MDYRTALLSNQFELIQSYQGQTKNSAPIKYDSQVLHYLTTISGFNSEMSAKILYMNSINLLTLQQIIVDQIDINNYSENLKLFGILREIKLFVSRNSWLPMTRDKSSIRKRQNMNQEKSQFRTPSRRSHYCLGNLHANVRMTKTSKKQLDKLDGVLQERIIQILNDINELSDKNTITKRHSTKLMSGIVKRYESMAKGHGGGNRIIWSFDLLSSKIIIVHSIVKHNVVESSQRLNKKEYHFRKEIIK